MHFLICSICLCIDPSALVGTNALNQLHSRPVHYQNWVRSRDQKKRYVCFYTSTISYCQNLFDPYLSEPGERIYALLQDRNIVGKKCPVSGNGLTLSTLNDRRSSAKVVTRLGITPNIM